MMRSWKIKMKLNLTLLLLDEVDESQPLLVARLRLCDQETTERQVDDLFVVITLF